MRRSRSVKAFQVPDENPGADEGLNLLGATLVLPAIQSIELPHDYSRAELAVLHRSCNTRSSLPITSRLSEET